jgi:threonine dehydrogenase-like Zn-dependent dehydrogenase
VLYEAIEVLQANKEKLAGFVTHRMALSEAAKAYSMFENHQARKIVLITGQ